jgi:hypothetical protein
MPPVVAHWHTLARPQLLTTLFVHNIAAAILLALPAPLHLHPAQETGEARGVLGPASSIEALQAFLTAMHQEADDFFQLARNGDGTVQGRLLMLANPGGAYIYSTPQLTGRSHA